MKILQTATTPNGIFIQLEYWKFEDGSIDFRIGVYPTAKNSSKSKWIEAGEKFRLTISENSYRNYTGFNVESDFEALKSGEKTLEDLAPYFWNGEKDMYLLGMIDSYEEDN